MVKEIVDTLTSRFDKDTLKLEIPQAFSYIKGSDAKMEMSVSNTLQPLTLLYDHNLVTDSIAFVFVNTNCRGLPYSNAKERGEYAATLFKTILQFDEVRVFTDLTKA